MTAPESRGLSTGHPVASAAEAVTLGWEDLRAESPKTQSPVLLKVAPMRTAHGRGVPSLPRDKKT